MARAVTLGLIPAPDIPEKIAEELASELPDLLSSRVDGGVSWDVAVVVDPLTGTDREAPEILDECREKMLSEGWDLALCLTDLPVYRGGAARRGGRQLRARRGRPLAARHGRAAAASEVPRSHPQARPRALREGA